MKKLAKANLNLINSFSLKDLDGSTKGLKALPFYQQLFKALAKRETTTEALFAQTHQLIRIADLAYGFRRLDISEEASGLLNALPLSEEFQSIALYYKALRLKREGEIDLPKKLLEEVAEKAPLQFRARALSSLGSLMEGQNFSTALSHRIQALRLARKELCDPLIVVEAQRAIAIYKSLNGDHKNALKDLYAMYPMVRLMIRDYPFVICDLNNSLAVEHLELGNIDEARYAASIPLASPYINAYPEWIETARDIVERTPKKSKSLVIINKGLIAQEHVVALNDISHTQELGPEFTNSEVNSVNNVLDFIFPKPQMIGKVEPQKQKRRKQNDFLPRDEQQMEIMTWALDKRTSNEKLREILEYIDSLETENPPTK